MVAIVDSAAESAAESIVVTTDAPPASTAFTLTTALASSVFTSRTNWSIFRCSPESIVKFENVAEATSPLV
ncbi:hypothetical protein [Halolamina salina]